jgi:hypothetical protein
MVSWVFLWFIAHFSWGFLWAASASFMEISMDFLYIFHWDRTGNSTFFRFDSDQLIHGRLPLWRVVRKDGFSSQRHRQTKRQTEEVDALEHLLHSPDYQVIDAVQFCKILVELFPDIGSELPANKKKYFNTVTKRYVLEHVNDGIQRKIKKMSRNQREKLSLSTTEIFDKCLEFWTQYRLTLRRCPMDSHGNFVASVWNFDEVGVASKYSKQGIIVDANVYDSKRNKSHYRLSSSGGEHGKHISVGMFCTYETDDTHAYHPQCTFVLPHTYYGHPSNGSQTKTMERTYRAKVAATGVAKIEVTRKDSERSGYFSKRIFRKAMGKEIKAFRLKHPDRALILILDKARQHEFSPAEIDGLMGEMVYVVEVPGGLTGFLQPVDTASPARSFKHNIKYIGEEWVELRESYELMRAVQHRYSVYKSFRCNGIGVPQRGTKLSDKLEDLLRAATESASSALAGAVVRSIERIGTNHTIDSIFF